MRIRLACVLPVAALINGFILAREGSRLRTPLRLRAHLLGAGASLPLAALFIRAAVMQLV